MSSQNSLHRTSLSASWPLTLSTFIANNFVLFPVFFGWYFGNACSLLQHQWSRKHSNFNHQSQQPKQLSESAEPTEWGRESDLGQYTPHWLILWWVHVLHCNCQAAWLPSCGIVIMLDQKHACFSSKSGCVSCVDSVCSYSTCFMKSSSLIIWPSWSITSSETLLRGFQSLMRIVNDKIHSDEDSPYRENTMSKKLWNSAKDHL